MAVSDTSDHGSRALPASPPHMSVSLASSHQQVMDIIGASYLSSFVLLHFYIQHLLKVMYRTRSAFSLPTGLSVQLKLIKSPVVGLKPTSPVLVFRIPWCLLLVLFLPCYALPCLCLFDVFFLPISLSYSVVSPLLCSLDCNASLPW